MSTNPYVPMQVKVERVVVENDAKDLKTFDLSFVNDSDRAAFRYTPGQFGFLSILGVGEAPFGIASAPHEPLVKYTVKRVGSFTTALHELEPGTTIGMRGPLGNSYPFDRTQGKDVVIVSGGFSFTTLRSKFGKLTCVYGARSAGELLYKDEIRAWESSPDISLHLCVDKLGADAWPKAEGLVPNVLKQVAPSAKNAVALVCGPPVMIRFTHPVLEALGFKPEQVFLSLENRMKCGIGKCGRCNIGPKYVCKDGPVFSYAELKTLPSEY